jgi:hypothetical protein
VKSPNERFLDIANAYREKLIRSGGTTDSHPESLLFLIENSGLRVVDASPLRQSTPEPQDPQSWFCPHCGCDRPQYTVLINNPVQMIGVGLIQTAALVCMGKLLGKDSAGGDILCRRVLSVQVVNMQLDNALLASSGRRRSPMEI